MAKIKKRKIRWEPSTSPQVVGYKLYWSAGEEVHYDSEFITVGNVTELVLPDDIKNFNPGKSTVTFAIAAIDEQGNESDLVTCAAPYQFSVPQAPKDLWLENLDAYYTTPRRPAAVEQPEPIPLFEKRLSHLEAQIDAEAAKVPTLARGAVQYSGGQNKR